MCIQNNLPQLYLYSIYHKVPNIIEYILCNGTYQSDVQYVPMYRTYAIVRTTMFAIIPLGKAMD